jgi:hypothetical protein
LPFRCLSPLGAIRRPRGDAAAPGKNGSKASDGWPEELPAARRAAMVDGSVEETVAAVGEAAAEGEAAAAAEAARSGVTRA